MAITAHLVDASPYIFRAWFSLPESITTPEGRPVNAVQGFADFLVKLIREQRISHLAVAFDGSLTTSFRNEIYPPYKAQRDLPPPELEAQLADCRELAAALGAATFVDERYEADDLIAGLCRLLTAAGHRVVVVSSDKDLCQLVGERVTLYDAARDERYDPARVREKFGVEPGQIADLLALAGDPVDNIPGVRGIGRKTAAALLAELGDLETVYRALDRVAELPLRGARSIARRLAAEREQALLSRRLATLADDVPAEVDLATLDLRRARADPDRLPRLLRQLGFERLLGRLGG